MVLAPSNELVRSYVAHGGVLEAIEARDPEILVEGPAGTGKTRGILEKLHRLCLDNDGLRVLICRKTLVSLSTSAVATLVLEVFTEHDPVKWFGGSGTKPMAYEYENGSTIIVGGMDNAEKILSSFYDVIFYNECLQASIDEWETLTGRLRHGRIKSMRIIGDCNPSFEHHWLNQRCAAGKTRRIKTRLQDNPAYFNRDGTMTELGEKYVSTLQAMTGARYQRYFLGEWAGMENAVYATFDRRRDGKPWHVRPLPEGVEWRQGAIGADQGRIHSAAAVTVKVDQYGRRWVVEAWGEPDPEEGVMTARELGRMALAHGVWRVRTDPTAAKVALATTRLMGGTAQVNAAEGSPGARIARIQMAQRLMATYPGGRVTKAMQEAYQQNQHGPYREEDSPALLFVEGAPGIDKLCAQIEGYHYEPIETPTRSERVLARKDDDLVAAMEYAIEELEADFVGVYGSSVENREVKKEQPVVSQYRFADPVIAKEMRPPRPDGKFAMPGRKR